MPPERRIIIRTDGDLSDVFRRQEVIVSALAEKYGVGVRQLFPGARRFLDDPASQCLVRYLVSDVPAGAMPEWFAGEVAGKFDLLFAYAEPRPAPPPLDPSDDVYRKQQKYLNEAPVGISASGVWPVGGGGFAGGDGKYVRYVDVEQGWVLDHEDLIAHGVKILFGENYAWHGHGAAVLGILGAIDNDLGCFGAAPNAIPYVASQYSKDPSNHLVYNTAEAIWYALEANVLAGGDVMLLEAQFRDESDRLLPVEAEPAAKCVITHAVKTRNIVIVEAAANGNIDLDTVEVYKARPFGATAGDSGAVLVGAGAAAAGHERMYFSNFGGRVDCYAWGELVTACGDGEKSKGTTEYTTSFGGTSAASAIVAGAAILAQSIAIAKNGNPMTPAALRSLFRDSRNTPTARPDRIGVMPDLSWIVGQI